MLKFVGLILVFCFFIFVGFYCSDFQKQKLSNCNKLYESMLKTKMLLRHWRKDKQKVLNSIDFNFYNNCYKNGKLDAELYNIANSYFNDMGSRDFNTELELLSLTISNIESRLEVVNAKFKQNIKLCNCFGVLVGLLFVIVFI